MRRLAGVDVARALAMLGMLVEHSVQYPTLQPKGALWSVYGRSGPLFVLLAGVGLSLATRIRKPFGRATIAARAPFLLLAGMAMSVRGDGVILQSFALFFVVGVVTVYWPRRYLAAAAALCLVGGPLLLTELRRHAVIHLFGTQTDVGFHGLVTPVAFGRGLLFSYYPAVIWLGFFFIGMLLGRADVSSAAAGRRLFGWAAAATVVVFTVGWAGARLFGPPPEGFPVAPPPLTRLSGNWTTYGFSNSVGWALSSTALALAVVGGCIWLLAVVRRPGPALSPLIALGAMSLSFYVLHFVYLGTAWEALQPHLPSPTSYLLASVAFWFAFALAAKRWLARFRRGPFESVLHVASGALVWPMTAARAPAPDERRVSRRVTPRA